MKWKKWKALDEEDFGVFICEILEGFYKFFKSNLRCYITLNNKNIVILLSIIKTH